MMDPLIDSKRLNEIFKRCLYQDPTLTELPEDAIIVRGLTITACFDPKNLPPFENEIHNYLDQLPAPFYRDTGGGWSFLNMCVDKNEMLWGQHRAIQELVILGIALYRVSYLLPRDLWEGLPGGVPYVAVYPKYLSRDADALVFMDTKIPVQVILKYIESGDTDEAIKEAFPVLPLESIQALRFTARSAAV